MLTIHECNGGDGTIETGVGILKVYVERDD
jgi:hypothetical protein